MERRKYFFIVEAQGCMPYVNLILDEDGDPMYFDNSRSAIIYASENCAWDYQIVEF